jgi:tRNA (Thr-GGU) A37 N-methylase
VDRVVQSPYTDPSRTPIKPIFAQKANGTVILDPGYIDALSDGLYLTTIIEMEIAAPTP